MYDIYIYGQFHRDLRDKFVFFQLCARALTTFYQINFGYIIAQSLDKVLFTIM